MMNPRTIMTKNIVICLDGTNNKLKAAVNTNVVRLFAMLDLARPEHQVGYYDPGVGTFSSPSAWTPMARTVSRFAGLMFGAGLRQNLGEAYSYLTSVYKPGDLIFVFGFSRGAYTARALTGMLDVFGIFRPGSDNLVPYAVSEYAKQQKRNLSGDEARKQEKEFFQGLRMYAKTHGVELPDRPKDHAPVHFVGLWDTVKAAGNLGRQLRWPYTRQLPHAAAIRHAVSIDEKRRPFTEYLVHSPDDKHLLVCKDQDLLEVWFAGVHSDVGGMFATGTRLSDIPFKWMADEAVAHGLLVRKKAYNDESKLTGVDPAGPVHKMNGWWRLLGPGSRAVPEEAKIHASVEDRIRADNSYRKRLPKGFTYVDNQWRTVRPWPKPSEALTSAPGDADKPEAVPLLPGNPTDSE
jgi:uncharacterized protein (DUF2235 family)